jgi:hypothetical protein
MKVNIADLSPAPLTYLGQVASLTLEQFQQFAACVIMAPQLLDKEQLSASAGVSVAKHHNVAAEIRARGEDPVTIMVPFSAAVKNFHTATKAHSWHEKLLTVYVTSGLLDEFFIGLASGLPKDLGPQMVTLLEDKSGRETIVQILRAAIEKDPQLGSHLALWGRRLVGDTLLLARSALLNAGTLTSDDERIEPVFTDLIGSHTRRMHELGLTA